MSMKKFTKRKTKGKRLNELDKIIKKYKREIQQNQNVIIIKKEV